MPKTIIAAVIFFIIASDIGASDDEKHLKQFNAISEGDKQHIKCLFKDLFDTHIFSYTLFGDKPLVFTDIILNPIPNSELLKIMRLEHYCEDLLVVNDEPLKYFKERWLMWKKYSPQLKINNYILMEKNIWGHPRILFINKIALTRVVTENMDLFKLTLGEDISGEKLLHQIESENRDLRDILKGHLGLLGILLGFGRHNAMLFHRRERLRENLESSQCAIINKSMKYQKSLDHVDEKLIFFHPHDHYLIASKNRVHFLADPNHEETMRLKTKYDQLNKSINKIYSKENWFELTLDKLIE